MEMEPYLFFSGNCLEALNFYKGLFGGEISEVSHWKDSPPEMGLAPEHGERVMHSKFSSPAVKFMGADARPTTQYGDGRISLSLQTRDTGEAKRIFDALAKGGKVEMPLEKAFWNALFGMLTDKYGIDWMVNCRLE